MFDTATDLFPDVATLGDVTEPTAAEIDEPEEVTLHGLPGLVPGSDIAQVVAAAWSGHNVIVKAPPGGGKTHLLARVAAWLAVGAGLKVEIVAFTREQRDQIALRVHEVVPGRVKLQSGKSGTSAPSTVFNVPGVSPLIGVRTVASARMSPPVADVILVDEAWQLPFADVAAAAGASQQIIMVGDPGQIGPVITADTSGWENLAVPPHHPAPEAFQRLAPFKSNMVTVTMKQTYRLGSETAALVSTFYDWPFTSARPILTLTDTSGAVLPELTQRVSPVAASTDDPAMLRTVTEAALSLVGGTVTGNDGSLPLDDSQIAVVVSRNSQLTAVAAMLRDKGHPDIVVGTADKLQGGQWTAVVALDPATGADDVAGRSVTDGRACVMLSRHTAHLTWVHDGTSIERMVDAGCSARGINVRRTLTDLPVR